MMCVYYRFAWFCLFSVSPFSCVRFVFFFLSWSATISTWRQALLSTIECQFSFLKPCEVYVSELLVWADAAVSRSKCIFVSFTMARRVWFLVTAFLRGCGSSEMPVLELFTLRVDVNVVGSLAPRRLPF